MPDNPENALVTGGGGFLGKAVVKKLVEKGAGVTSLSRSRYQDLSDMGVRQIQGDICDPGVVARTVEGIDTVYHAAARAGVWGKWEEFYKPNVLGTKTLVKACLEKKVSRFIYTSSPSVVFDGTDMEGVDESVPYPEKYCGYYPETKAMAEKIVVEAARNGLCSIILRPHLIWGPGDTHLVPGIISRAKRLKRIGPADDLVDTVYVDNAADAHLLASDRLAENSGLSGNIYFISQNEPVSKWDMADAFLEAAGLEPIKGRISGKTAYLAGWMLEMVYTLFRIQSEPPMTRFVAKELATSHWFDITRAVTDLGYEPRVSIREGLFHLKQWLQPQKGGE
ncbi:MAG: NAD-dependent epimerase/dehydratase family protein [Thermodesulfobacteriota bacterium]